MLKVIIAGGRDFKEYQLLCDTCDKVLKNQQLVQIVSGGAKGADALGEKYAEANGYNVKKFSADWDNLGKKAGPIRNAAMSDYADCLIAFWDGESKGTKHMIDFAKTDGLKVRVVKYKPIIQHKQIEHIGLLRIFALAENMLVEEANRFIGGKEFKGTHNILDLLKRTKKKTPPQGWQFVIDLMKKNKIVNLEVI